MIFYVSDVFSEQLIKTIIWSVKLCLITCMLCICEYILNHYWPSNVTVPDGLFFKLCCLTEVL